MLQYTIPPSFENQNRDVLWIEFSAYKLPQMESYVPKTSNPDSNLVGSIIGKWKFLAPLEILEDVSHSWEETETIHSRIAKKSVTWKKGYSEIKQGVNALSTGIMNKLSSSDSIDSNISLSKLAMDAIKVDIPPYKMDMPVVYTNSNRLQYSLNFNLALLPDKSTKGRSAAEIARTGIFEPVRELERLSCAIMEEEFTKISFPAVFSIKTVGSDIINIPRAALTAVQPTWKSPYAGGYPMACDLQITFINMLPLYSNNFEGNTVTTNNPHEMNG